MHRGRYIGGGGAQCRIRIIKRKTQSPCVAARRGLSGGRRRGADAFRAPAAARGGVAGPGVLARTVRAARAGGERHDSRHRYAGRARRRACPSSCATCWPTGPRTRRAPQIVAVLEAIEKQAWDKFGAAFPRAARRAPPRGDARRRRRRAGAPGPGATASSSSWCWSATTTPKSARRRNCATNSCRARGAPACRSRKSDAPRRSEPRDQHGFRRNRRGLGDQWWLGRQGIVRARPEDAAARARPPRRPPRRLPGLRARPGRCRTAAACPKTRRREHYAIQSTSYAFNSATKQWWVRDSEHPYSTPPDRPFSWIRGYHLGGRSITWGRQTYRHERLRLQRQPAATAMASTGRSATPTSRRGTTASSASPEFPAPPKDSSNCPTGSSCRRMELNCLELAFKQQVEADHPTRRVTVGALRASHRAHGRAHRARPRSLPVAQRVRARLRLRRVFLVAVGHAAGGAARPAISPSSPTRSSNGSTTTTPSGASPACASSTRRRSRAGRTRRAWCSCAPRPSAARRSCWRRAPNIFPNGLANRSDARGPLPHGSRGRHRRERHASGFPRSLLLRPPAHRLLSTALHQHHRERTAWTSCAASPSRATRAAAAGSAAQDEVGVGAELKQRLRSPGRWEMRLVGFGEMLPRADNRVTLDESAPTSGAFRWCTSTARMARTNAGWPSAPTATPRAMLAAAGFENIAAERRRCSRPGIRVHEMGTARMGHDPATSVLNRYNQAHDVSNLFVTDGSCMTSIGHRESVADLHGAVGARGESRRRPAGIRRNLRPRRCAALSGAGAAAIRAAPARSARDIRAPSRAGPARLRPAQSACGGPGGGFRDHRNPFRYPGCSDLPYWPAPVPRPSLLRRATRTPRRCSVHAEPVLAGVPRLSRRPSAGRTLGGPFACLGGVFWA